MADQEEVFFDQKEQTVKNQTNVAGDLNVAGNYVAGDYIAKDQGPEFESLQRSYLSHLLQQTKHLPLECVDPKAAEEAACRQLQLSAVYTALMTETTQENRLEMTPRKPVGEKTRRLSALEMLNKEKYLVLLGDPGSGKSTFVNFVATCLAGELLGSGEANIAVMTAPVALDEDMEKTDGDEKVLPQAWNIGQILPVRVVLRDLAARGLPSPGEHVSVDTLWWFIQAELGATLAEDYGSHLKKILREKGGLILLDGLDEVPDANKRRLQVKQAVQGFAALFPKCRMLVTSRTYAYQYKEWKLEGFAASVLSDFTFPQIQRFVNKWYENYALMRGVSREDAKGRALELATTIKRTERLRELAVRPILLTLMASLHAWRGGSLPEKREALYADAVELLLYRWEGPKIGRGPDGKVIVKQPSLSEWLKLDREMVRTRLDQLAYEIHRDQPKLTGTADIAEDRLVAALMKADRDPDRKYRRLVEYLSDRSGIIAPKCEAVYSFPHRTFQEYLAACYLSDEGFPEKLARLSKADPQRWREVVLLAGAKVSRGTIAAVWILAEELCWTSPPENKTETAENTESWGALLAAQTLLECDRNGIESPSARNKPKLETIRRWLTAIVEQDRLPPLERGRAGEALAVLGDDRDLEELIHISAGPFWMGDDANSDAEPCHELHLPAYKIGRFPVTNGRYRRFAEKTGRKWYLDAGQRVEKATCPVTDITWYDACAYCRWITDLWRQERRITMSEVVHLPSEAQWEKAARGEDRRIYPWGDKWDSTRCNSDELGLGQTTPVGIFPQGRSPYGCLDMAGNVWEWTRSLWGKDWEEPEFKYPYDPSDGREDDNAAAEILRVLRGGSWLGSRYGARCSYRFRLNPSDRTDLGFRVAVSPISSVL
jgi:formylglycine-generating enzyme required for sulfatase activity/energy-coupling factor transporter ATP-binding protein EcfA2